MIFSLVISLLISVPARARCDSELRASQWRTQRFKDQRRWLAEYETYLTRGARSPRNVEYRRVTGLRRGESWVEFLRRLGRRKGRAVRWADAGAGFAVALRQLARDHADVPVERIAIDFFDWDRTRHRLGEQEMFDGAGADVLDPRFKPPYVLGDVTNVVPAGQDIITSIEVIQYLPDKLAALADWYNKLAVGGLLIVSTDHHFSDQIFADHGPLFEYDILARAIEDLRALGIRVVSLGEPGRTHTLAIRRRAGVRLRANVKPYLAEAAANGYVRTHYGPESLGSLFVPRCGPVGLRR